MSLPGRHGRPFELSAVRVFERFSESTNIETLIRYYPLTRAFQSTSGNIGDLVNEMRSINQQCKDSTLLGNFLENHDNPRFPSLTGDVALAQNAIAFTILADGIPIIYQGQEQHFSGSGDPGNREALWLSGYSTTSPLYRLIASVNQIRNEAIYVSSDYVNYKAWIVYSDSNTIATRKGFDGHQIIAVFTNKGANGNSYTLTLTNTGYTSGEKVTEILSCTAVTVDNNSSLPVSMGQGLPKVRLEPLSARRSNADLSKGVLPHSSFSGQRDLQALSKMRKALTSRERALSNTEGGFETSLHILSIHFPNNADHEN